MSHRVAVLALDPVVAFDLATAVQVLGPNELDDAVRYDVTVCARRAGAVGTTHGYALHAPRGLGAVARADTVIVPGFDPRPGGIDPVVLRALRRAHGRGARIASICTGAYALAAAGLLDGRRATTHWAHAADLARRHPAVRVDPGVLFVDEGDVLTSAGVAAGIDLCLHLVRLDHGAAAANAVARRMVVAPLREGGQAQFVPAPLGDAGGASLARTRAWALGRLAEPLRVDALAAHAGYSPRTFLRRFRAETGTTPLAWLHAARIGRARELLESTGLPVEQVASRCGFGSAVALRRHFLAATATTPSAYRRAFLATGADAA
jgi:transcriptional regulator GlxA family with amidase domain